MAIATTRGIPTFFVTRRVASEDGDGAEEDVVFAQRIALANERGAEDARSDPNARGGL